MYFRVLALLGLSLIFVAGIIAVAQHMSVAQTPSPPAAGEPTTAVAPVPPLSLIHI